MRQPPFDLLMKKVDNKYSMVVQVAKRARKIAENLGSDEDKTKPVTRALFEVVEDKSMDVE